MSSSLTHDGPTLRVSLSDLADIDGAIAELALERSHLEEAHDRTLDVLAAVRREAEKAATDRDAFAIQLDRCNDAIAAAARTVDALELENARLREREKQQRQDIQRALSTNEDLCSQLARAKKRGVRP